MTESVKQRASSTGNPMGFPGDNVYLLLIQIQADLQQLMTALNTHTHGGIATGAGTSGAPNANTVAALNTTP